MAGITYTDEQTYTAQPAQQTSQPQQSGGVSYDQTGYWGDLGYLLGNGVTDSVRGGAQILGVKEDEMRGQQQKVDSLLEQHGAAGYAAWIGGMMLDPVGWLIPMSRLRNLGKIAAKLSGAKKVGMAGKAAEAVAGGAAGGTLAGGLSYVDENAQSLLGEGEMTRGEQALIGALGGGVLMGAGGTASAAIRKANNDKVIKMVDDFKAKGMTEEEAWAEASQIPITRGEKVWAKVGQNPEVAIPTVGAALGGFAGYQSGINEQTEPLFGDLFGADFTNEGGYARWRNALMGAAVGAGGTKLWMKKDPRVAHWFTPDMGIEDGMRYAKARAGPRRDKMIRDEIDPLNKKLDDLIQTADKVDRKAISELMYKMVNQGPKMARELSQGLSSDDTMNELARKILADSPELMKNIRGLTTQVRKKVRDMGKQMVDAGLLDKRVWAKNRGKYLHRIYSKPGEAQDIMSRSGYQVIGDELEPRGLVRQVDEEEFAKIQKEEPDLAWERWDDSKEFPAAEGKFNVRRDWTPEERLQMGEHMDLLDAFQKTGALMAHDISAGKYMDELAKAPTVSSATRTEGAWGNPTRMRKDSTPELNARDTRASMASNPPDFGPMKYDHVVQVPDEKRYGNLRTRWVSKEALEDLKGMMGNTPLTKALNSKMMRKYQKVNAFWKATKTIMNPAVHFNNAMSNVMHYDMGVTNMGLKKWALLASAGRDLMRGPGKMSDDALEAMERGVFQTNLTEELRQGFSGDVAQSINKAFHDKANLHPQKIAEQMMDHTSRVAKSLKAPAVKAGRAVKKQTYDRMAALYAYEDNIFRLAMYKAEKQRLLDSGMIDSMAADRAASKAREWFVDYSRQTPALAALRSIPLPFLSYTYGIIPRLAETAIKNPIKIAKWASVTYLLNEAAAYGSEQTVAKTKEEERIMSELYGKRSGIGTLNRIRLPDKWNPFDTESAYFDITRMTPGGMPFAEKRGGVGQIKYLPESLQPGMGALGGILWPSMGVDQFRGKEIPVGERGAAMLKQFTPNVIGLPGSYAQSKLDRALGGKKSRYSDEHTVGTAIASGFGAKITPNDTRKNKQRIRFAYDAKISVVDSQIRRLRTKSREGMISQDKFKKQLETLKNKRQRIKKNRRKAIYG